MISMPSTNETVKPQTDLRGILWGGFLSGLFDLSFAIVVYGLLRDRTAISVLHSISSGLLGKAAYEGGLATAALGLVCHFVIAFGAATVFWLVSWRLRFLLDHPVVSGVLFGVAVFAFMTPSSSRSPSFPSSSRIR